MTDDERRLTTMLAAQFLAGEESVTQDLQPFIAAMAALASASPAATQALARKPATNDTATA